MFDWLNGIISSVGDSISSAIKGVGTNVSSAVWDSMLQWIYKSIFDALSQFFTMMGDMGVGIFDLSWVQAVVQLFSYFGWALFACGLVIAVFDVAVEAQSGRVNIKTTAINFIKGFMAVNLFTVVPIELYKFCITLQGTFSGDLTRIFAGEQNTDLSGTALNVLNSTMNSTTTIFNLLLLIALGYCVVKIFFANIKRGGILLIQIAVGSLYLFSVPRGYNDGFIRWCKQIIAICLTAFLQTTLLFLGLLTWKSDMLMAVGIMLAANEVPRIAQEFGLDTSVNANMMNVIHYTQSAINLTKSIAKAGT